jgi:putative acetyltransferase
MFFTVPGHTVRPYREADAAALAEVFFRSVRQAALADYSPAQVRAWLQERPDPERMAARAADGRLVLVAEDPAGTVVAYVDLEADGHIDHLYCLPEAVGRGVASMLYRRLEEEATGRGLSELRVEASEGARRLFLRHGFRTLERRLLRLHGVTLHNYAMAKRLIEPARGGDENPCDDGQRF